MHSNQLKIHLSTPHEFSYVTELFVGEFNQITQVIHNDIRANYAKRSFAIDLNDQIYELFIQTCEELLEYQKKLPFFLPISFIIEAKDNISPALITPYYEKRSLRDLIMRQNNDNDVYEFDEYHKIIFIYCLSLFLEQLHLDNKFHGNLKASNIIIDNNFYPLVSDLFFYKLHNSNTKEKSIDSIVSLPPEISLNIDYSIKSDIYSFGIIVLQIFQQKINIFSNKDQDISEIEDEIKNYHFDEIIDILPKSIRSIILKCLSYVPEDRPNASEIRSTIQDIISKPEYNELYTKLQRNLIKTKFESENDEKELKKEIENNNIEYLFKYAVKIKQTNEDEALLYFRYGANQIPSHTPSLKYYESIFRKRKEQAGPNLPVGKEPQNKFVHLMNDPFFMKTKIDMNAIVDDVNKHFNDEEIIEFNKEDLKKKGFILTKGAQKRLTKICRYILEGVPVLLEGDTGTTKTKSVQICCEILNKRLVKYNLSSETKTGDLLGRYVGDPNSWSGIKMHEGPFVDAFEGRKDDDDNELSCVLLLDEINLANQECLHFIEETLDSDEISTEIPGMPLKKIPKGPGFRLIATQNPNKGLFMHKRQDLGLKFYSRFQVIHFPKLKADELKDIALGLADCEDFNYKDDEKLINDLVDFHVKWSELPEIKDEVQCFTVREIEGTIHALRGNDALNPYDAVMTIYGARYQKEKKYLLTETLLSFESFKKYQIESIENQKNFKYIFNGIEFPSCYHNKNLADALQSVFISFKMNRHVILAGEEGCGLTKIARLIAQCHNMKLNDEKNDKEYFCICTEETKCSDLIGSQRASESIKKTKSLIKWKQGFLCKAIKSGHCAILDSIDEATSTVTERINPLLDHKFDSGEMKFDVPENPNEPEITIDPNFRLLCTCKVDKINQMSPAFINRFDVIVLENQLENIDENELKNLILMLMKEATISPTLLPNKNKENKEEKDNDDWFDFGNSYSYSESDDEKNDEEEQEAVEEISKELQISDEIIDLVYQKLDIKNLPSFQNISQFCKAVARYLSFFEKDKTITLEEIVDFSYKMLQKTTEFADDEIPKSMIDYLLDNLKNKDNEINGQFIYKESQVLRTFVAKLHAASIINLPVCVYGPTGVGKTSAAEQFSKERSNKGYQKHSFHAGTKPNHFYATTTIQDKKISLTYGSLTKAMINGQVFIADEMNLSSLTNMKSLAPALEPCIGKDVFIPGIGKTISIDPDFFFIACQNELGTLGRNAIPSSIASRFRYFDYPELKDDEIAELCVLKRIALYSKQDIEGLYSKENFIKDSRNLGHFMTALNGLKQRVIPKWSFRDITKIFLRICQQDDFPNKYRNITFYHQVLFFTMSVANEEDSKAMLEKICDLIQEKFELSTDQRNEIFDCYICDPVIDRRFIMKGKSGVLSTECDINSPAPLLNALFITKLSHESEPIIYMGTSGYKTYLAKKLLRNAKTITLNQESTNAQLLGKSYPFTKTESKLFYLDMLTKILNISYDVAYNLKEKLQNNDLKFNEFIEVVSSIPEEKQKTLFDRLQNGQMTLGIFLEKIFVSYLNRKLPESFKYAFINLTTKLFTESDLDNNSIISNFVFEFKPGLFLSSILEGKSLILKNLSNLPTIVFERFNEVFSGEHSLTLQEDINNTFTEEETNRKLSEFNDVFRVFGTCPPNSITKLSEAVLSRFTVIYTHEYRPKDQKKVLFFLENLKLDQSLIDYVINFSEQMSNEPSIKKPIPFIQMITIIEMCSKLIAMHEMIDQKDLLKTVLYRAIIGLFEKRDRMKGKLREKINNIFNDIGIPLGHELTSPLSENPIYVSTEKGIQVVKSKLTNISIESPTAHEVEDENITFTKMFVEMVETLLLGLASNTPVILEGLPGQGKQTAIKFLADTLGYNIINIMISQSTKADDLLGKLNISYDDNHNIRVEIIKTKLVEAIESEEKASSSIIVFHNINHASSAVLEVIQTIFDPHESNICLTNGTLIPKGKLNLIGIYNTQNGYSNRANLPSSLIYSSLYYIVNNPTKEELRNVIQKLFKNTEFQTDWESLYLSFNITNKIAKENNSASILTLNDVVKYIIFRKATYTKFDKDIISQMIFAYRFINEETIKEVKKQINVKDMNFSPSFTYNSEKTLFNINVKSDDSKEFREGININLFSNQINNEEIESNIACLTLPQKHCLLFLACSVLSKRSCILQGSTSSGKSHIIRLFAKMLGQELIVYQMNKDIGISILTGQPLLSSTLSNEDIDNIILWFENISIIPAFKDYIKENFSENPKEWKLADFSDLLSYIERNKEMISEDNKEFINNTVIEIKKIIRHEKRFTHQESEFIKALKEGKWVLIDGIESAPPEIAQKISSLCGDDPELHLIECGKNNYFARNKKENAQPISDNFHLFVTFNPSSQKENISLDPAFFNKCVSFSLPPIDSAPEYSAQILHGSLLKMSYPNEIAIEIGARMSMSHKVAKNESINNNDVFAGDLQFTGRTLKFITSEFQLHSEQQDDISNNIYIPVCNSFHSFYWNSEMKNVDKLSQNEGKLKKDMIDAFSKSADNDIIASLNQKSDNPKVRNADVLMILRSIQLLACKKVEKSEFSYEFIQKCRKTRLSDVSFVIKHIEDTISIINDHSMFSDEVNQFECHQLIIILNILKEINSLIPNVSNEFKDVPLDNNDLLTIDDKLEFQLLKLQLLEKLQNDNFAYINSKTPIIFFNQRLFNLFQVVIDMTQNQTIDHFNEFISIISKDQQLIPLIEDIFPYNLFIDTPFETMNYWMPMIANLYNKKVTFHVKINDYEYDFINNESKFEPTYIFDQNNVHETLLLYPGTQLKIHSSSNKDSKSKHSHEKHKKKHEPKLDINYEDLLKKNYEIFGMTQSILSSNTIDESKLDSEKKKYSTKAPFPKENQKSKFILLLPKNAPKRSMVSNIWSLIFSIHEGCSDILFRYLHPLEVDVFKCLSQLLQSLNRRNINGIISLTKWMNDYNSISFGDENRYIWKLYDGSLQLNVKLNENKIQDQIDMVQNEIEYLSSSPKIIGWSTTSYIDLLKDKVLLVYQQRLQEIISSNQERKIKAQLIQLLKDVRNSKPSKYGHTKFKESFVNAIENIINNNPSEELLEECQANYNDFIRMISKDNSNFSKENFNWPSITNQSFNEKQFTATIKLYQHILWYSQASSIVERIINQNDDNIVKDISDLCEIPDMREISSYLINKICQNSNLNERKIDNQCKNMLKSTLNAHFICKLIRDNLFDKIDDLDSILNNLERRKSENSELAWINAYANKYPLDLQIVLPHFLPNDIFSLFVCYENEKTPSCGPYLRDNKIIDKNLVNSLATFLNKKVTNDKTKFTKYCVSVGIEIYRNKINNLEDIPKDFDNFRSFIQKDLNSIKEEKNKEYILNHILSILSIGEKLVFCPKFAFTFNDTLFLEKGWIDDEIFVNKYPSLVYWLSLHEDCKEKLQYIFGNYEFSDQKLPFWLFALRIMSSQKCIQFCCQNQSRIANIIKDTINKSTLSFFEKSRETSYGTNWINFLLPKVPSEIFNSNYKMLYQFFINLAQDNASNQKLINEQKEKVIVMFAQKITEIVFEDSIYDLLNMPFNQRDNINSLSFIINPQFQVDSEVNKILSSLFASFMNNTDFNQLKCCSNNINEELDEFIEKLKNLAQYEDNIIESEFEKNKDDSFHKIKKEIYYLSKEYNSLLNDLMRDHIKSKGFVKKICRLYEISQHRYLKRLKEDHSYSPLKINLYSYEYDDRRRVQIIFTNPDITPFEFTSDPNWCQIYFRDKDYSYDDLLNSRLELVQNKQNIKKFVEYELYYPYIIDDQTIHEISINESNKPYLLFGNRFKLDDYIKEIKMSILKLITLIKEIEDDIIQSNINFESISKLVQINKTVDDLIKLFNVKYSNGNQRKLNNITNHLKDLANKLKHIKTYSNNLNNYIRNQNIQQNYGTQPTNKMNMFSFNYGLPFPSTDSPNIDKSIFSYLNNCDFLSSPFLSVEDDDSISCCFETLECSIGPIIPSLYSGNVTLNFISFIDGPITIEIKTKDEQYQSWFHSKTFNPKDIVKIFVLISNLSLNKHENFDIEADIIISSPGLRSLILPGIFHIIIAPQIIYISCNKYSISLRDSNIYLCTNKLMSNEELSFPIHNHNINEPLNYKVQFESLDNNESPKPDKNTYLRNNLNIIIPKVENPTRIHCAINLKFSEKLQTKVIIDSIIIPFDFSFYLFDYTQKRYVTDTSRIIYSNQYFNRPIILHCRITCPIFDLFKDEKVAFKGFFFSNLSQGVYITSNGIGESFDINEDTDFDIHLNIKNILEYNQTNSISIKINNVEKRINLVYNFPERFYNDKGKLDPYYLNKYDFYYGMQQNKEWIKIDKTTQLENILAICSPFNSIIIKQPQLRYNTERCEIVNSKDNIFVYLSTKGKISIKKEEKSHTDNKIRRLLFDYEIPLFGVFQNEWYPVFDVYSKKLRQEKLELMEITEENSIIAKQKVDELSTKLELNYFEKFATLLFKNAEMINGIKNIINHEQLTCFKENLDCSDQVLYHIEQYESCDEKLKAVISYNIILLLHESFARRFFSLKLNSFKLKSIISDEELEEKSNQLYEQYRLIEDDAIRQNRYNSKREIEKIMNSISKIKCSDIPPLEEQNEAYLLGIDAIPVKRNIPQKFISISTKGSNVLSNKNIAVHLPDITLPSLSNSNDLNIIKMNDFYLTCLKGTRILPIFVKNIANEKTDENISQAFDYFVLLYRTFMNLQDQDKSIISQAVNEFRESFYSMLGKFSRAGIDVSKIIGSRYIPTNETNQDFISYPNKIEIYLPPDLWDNNKMIQQENSIMLQNITENDRIHVGEHESFEEEPQFFDKTKVQAKESQVVSSETTSIKSEKVQVALIHTMSPNDDKEEESDNDNYDDYDDDDEYDDSEDNKKVDSKNRVHVTLDKESVEISNENLDGLVSNFSERDSIKASIARMNEMNEMSNLVVNECSPPKIDPQFFKQPPNENPNNLPIQSLIKQSLALSHNLIIAISNQDIPFSNLCANILVDCSCFISVENKMFNMLLICALTTALDVLSIPYSVAVFGDSNFKCVIKSFEENHSSFALQKVLDCLFIKRFCSNLPTAVKFAIDNMEHDKRKQRAIFTFTSGLDDQIRLTKSWAESMFNKDMNSFHFIFIKSKELESKDEDYLMKVWKNFETETKKYGALSNVKVTPINPQLTSFSSFSDGFVSVMKRNNNELDTKQLPFAQPTFDLTKQLQDIGILSQLIDEKSKNMFSDNNEIYVETTDVLKSMTSKIDRLDVSLYRNKLGQIIKSHSEKRKDNFNSFLKKFIENRTKINQSTLETIFRPNKASQTVLSNTGSDIDITALILNIITPVPDPLIYLEEKGGLIRNYGVSVIIDPSMSCLFNLSAAHTLLTIKNVLSSFAALDLPCFDLIVSGNPQPTILCSEVGTLHTLDHKSNIWEPLFTLLQNPIQKSDLASAINAAYDIKRMRSKDYTSLLFVVTDGLYEKSNRNRILQVVNNCVQSGIAVFGIGVGTYPKGIEELFPQVIFSPNPSLVMKCVASIFGDPISNKKEKMPPIYPMDLHIEDIKSSFNSLIKNEDKPIFSGLKEELSKIKHLQDAFRHYLNSEGDIGNAQKGFTNFEGKNAEMYKRNTFQTQKILIVMLWDYSMNPAKESRELQMKYIFENINFYQKECIKTAVEHFGITIDVVQNYKSAIEKLLKQDKPGFCNYYSVWIMCGPPIGQLPDNSSFPNLVGQFIEVITQFWMNGGSLVFWAEGEPLYYQVNLFLEKNRFNFKIEGNHEGRRILTPDESNDLRNKKTFNRHPQGDETNERSTLAHNLGKIFEGVTISYAKYDLDRIKPFIPFSRDSEGGISSMFLPSNKLKGTGDIVIDCGYTKCFANLTEDGTYRYIQNIAGWTMNMESHIAAGYSPKEWRPKAIKYTVNLSASWSFPMVQRRSNVDIVFVIDTTGSMRYWLMAAKNRAREIANASRSRYPNTSFHFGAIFYKDPVVQPRDSNVYCQPTDNMNTLVNFMSMQRACGGGGDGPEDWAGAYEILLHNILFRRNATCAVIHIADAPAHGSDWGGNSGRLEREGARLTGYIRDCARHNIFFSGIDIGDYGTPSFRRVKAIYRSEGKSNLFKYNSISNVDANMAGNFLQDVAANLISSIAAF